MDVFGFTVLPSVLTPAEAASFADLLDAADEEFGSDYVHDGAFSRHVANMPARAVEFLALVDNPVVLEVVESVLGSDIVLGSMNARIVRPGDPQQGLHSDIPRVHRRLVGPPIMLQAVWMIDGFTAENGATRVVLARIGRRAPRLRRIDRYLTWQPRRDHREACSSSTASVGTAGVQTTARSAAEPSSPTIGLHRGCGSRRTPPSISPLIDGSG